MKKKKIKFPVIKNNVNHSPSKALCPWCKKKKVFEPHSFATISGGVTVKEKSKFNNHSVWQDLEAYLDISWHGSHNGGEEKNRDIYRIVNLSKDVAGGQFEVYFCSTKCLRGFLNNWVDELEDKIKKL